MKKNAIALALTVALFGVAVQSFADTLEFTLGNGSAVQSQNANVNGNSASSGNGASSSNYGGYSSSNHGGAGASSGVSSEAAGGLGAALFGNGGASGGGAGGGIGGGLFGGGAGGGIGGGQAGGSLAGGVLGGAYNGLTGDSSNHNGNGASASGYNGAANNNYGNSQNAAANQNADATASQNALVTGLKLTTDPTNSGVQGSQNLNGIVNTNATQGNAKTDIGQLANDNSSIYSGKVDADKGVAFSGTLTGSTVAGHDVITGGTNLFGSGVIGNLTDSVYGNGALFQNNQSAVNGSANHANISGSSNSFSAGSTLNYNLH